MNCRNRKLYKYKLVISRLIHQEINLPPSCNVIISVGGPMLVEVVALATLLCDPAIQIALEDNPAIISTLTTFFTLIMQKQTDSSFPPFLEFQNGVNSLYNNTQNSDTGPVASEEALPALQEE